MNLTPSERILIEAIRNSDRDCYSIVTLMAVHAHDDGFYEEWRYWTNVANDIYREEKED